MSIVNLDRNGNPIDLTKVVLSREKNPEIYAAADRTIEAMRGEIKHDEIKAG